MSVANQKNNVNQLKSFCVVFPDSCTLLNYIFSEEEFKLKIGYYAELVQKGISNELLPKVTDEIFKKLTSAVSDFVYTLRRCKFYCQSFTKESPEKTKVNKDLVEILELSFSKVLCEMSDKGFSSVEMKNLAIRRARVVETSVVEEFEAVLENNQELSLRDFFGRWENRLKDKYSEFCNKQSLFMNELRQSHLKWWIS